MTGRSIHWILPAAPLRFTVPVVMEVAAVTVAMVAMAAGRRTNTPAAVVAVATAVMEDGAAMAVIFMFPALPWKNTPIR
jgi:Kef-type K+ transport system membrane component KefB